MTFFGKYQRLILLLSVIGMGLTGCTSLLPDAEDLPPRVTLVPLSPEQINTPASAQPGTRPETTLVIADPTSASVYNTFSMAIATAPQSFQYVADAEWTDRAPILVQRFLEQSLDASGRFLAVASEGHLGSSAYRLQTDIRAFHLDAVDSSERGVVHLTFRLLDSRGRIIGTHNALASADSVNRSQTSRAAAMNRASQDVAIELIMWIDETIAGLQG